MLSSLKPRIRESTALLEFLEVFLSTSWRGFLRIRKTARIILRGSHSITDLPSSLVMKAARAARKYRSTLDVRHMRAAVNAYSRALALAKQNKSHLPTELWVEGVHPKEGRADFLQRLDDAAASAGVIIRISKNIFRPDVPYRFEGDWGMHSGIGVLIQRPRDGAGLEDFLAFLSQDLALVDLETRILSISNLSSFYGSVTANIRDLLPVLEGVGDRETAAKLIPSIGLILGENIELFGELEFGKLWLISRLEMPKSLEDLGWIGVRRLSPTWNRGKRALTQSSSNADPEDTGSMPTGNNLTQEIRLAIAENATVFKGDTVLVGEAILDIDPAANPSFDFVAGRWDHVVGTHLDFSRAAVKVPSKSAPALGEAILLASRADSNWFHWLIETLPKFQHLDVSVSRDVPVLLSKRIPETAKESIRLLTDRELVYLDDDTAIFVEILHIASPVLFHPDTPELWLKPVADAVNYRAIFGLRNEILSKSKQALSQSPSPHSIYVARLGGARSILNSKQVARVLGNFGFSVFDPGQMSLMEQVVAFHSAKRIVLAGGAAMANLIFCSAGAAVVTLGSKFTKGYKMPEILAGVAGARVISISGHPVGTRFRSSFQQKIHSNYYIGIRQLTRAVRKAL